MKTIIFNHDHLDDSDISEIVVRTKALLINDKEEIILGYSDKTYQFPGGHLEESETLEQCLIREIKEETGIELKEIKEKPFVKIVYYSKNYRSSGKNRKNEIYYYVIKTNEKYNLYNISLDEWEKEGNFTIKVIPIKDLDQILIDSILDNSINKIIVEEMLTVLKEYRRTL